MPPVGAHDVLSAGAVVLGRGETVLLVHRPKYDDWSFPKGKLDPGEHATTAAVREVHEETGARIRLGLPLSAQRYEISEGHKHVSYWIGRTVAAHDAGAYRPNEEIDEVTWLPLDKARLLLTYDYDRDTLDEALSQQRKTRTLVVLRHAVARSRRTWRRTDQSRPLLAQGRRQAGRLVPVLAAYDVRRLVTSGSARCVETLEAYARASGQRLRREDVLSEEEASHRGVDRLLTRLVADLEERPAAAGGLVVCTHRPVLPMVFEALGLADTSLAPAELMVLHLRKGRVLAAEHHVVG